MRNRFPLAMLVAAAASGWAAPSGLVPPPGAGPGPGGPPPPPAAAVAEDPGPSRIHQLVGVNLNADFWAECAEALPLAGPGLLAELETHWAGLEAATGFHPMKHLRTVARVGFGPARTGVEASVVVLLGQFDLGRLAAAIEADPTLRAQGLKVGEKAGAKRLELEGASLLLRDPGTLVLFPPDSEAAYERLRMTGSPDPADLPALIDHFGLGGTNGFAHFQVTPQQRLQLSRTQGPLALLGPSADSLTVRFEAAALRVGLLFNQEQPAVQVEGIGTGLLTMIQAAAKAQLAMLDQPGPAGGIPAESFLGRLDPQKAAKRSMMKLAAGWLAGIKLSRNAGAIILDVDRTKVPFLRVSSLTPLVPTVGALIPSLMAWQQAQGIQGMGIPAGMPFFGMGAPKPAPAGGLSGMGVPTGAFPPTEGGPPPAPASGGTSLPGGALPPIPVPSQ